MGCISVLDQNMINMIAAGEVIERPASVVKELMENSLDAGATRIAVDVEDGGRKLVRVQDNGAGMAEDDLAMAFDAHATSKIRTYEDLHRIVTMGFRGEALASIAAVSQVLAVSRRQGEDAAHRIEIDCGQKSDVQPCSGDLGTTIHVRDLFYKLPARRKFLRTAATEMGHIVEQFIRIALGVYGRAGTDPATVLDCLDLTLTHNGREVYRLPADQTIHQRVMCLFPMLAQDQPEGMIEVHANEKGVRIYGLLGRPEVSRTDNHLQYVFLNGRFLRDKSITHAIKEAYRGLLEPQRHPVVFLLMNMATEEYDVNVHPTKTEVRFYNSNLVHSQVLGALRERLLGTDLTALGRMPPPESPERLGGRPASGSRSQRIGAAMADFFSRQRFPAHEEQTFGYGPSSPGSSSPVKSPSLGVEQANAVVGKIVASCRRFMQIHDTYIVVATEDGFILVDQHALHEKILYERFCQDMRSSGLLSQRLLLPQAIAISDQHASLLEIHADLIRKLGIEVVPFGPRTVAVQAFPALLDKAGPASFVQDLLGLLETEGDLEPDRVLDAVLSLAACKAAIKAGQHLADHEIERLLADGQAMESACRCPHGRPTTIRFTLSEIQRQFLRT